MASNPSSNTCTGSTWRTGPKRSRVCRLIHRSMSAISSFESPEYVFESLRAGATGYVLKRAPSVQILDAIREVCAGGAPMSGAVARLVVEHFGQHKRSTEIDTLSDRERAVLVALSEGQQYKEIAASLNISINTVRSYIRSIYEKLHVNSRLDAIKKLGRD